MTDLTRRQFVGAGTALALLSALPTSVFAQDAGTLKIAIAAETGDLDLLTNVSSLSSYTIVFDGLVHYGPNGTIQPGLAESWEVAPDGLSITFNLRKGVTFSDGTPFDAAAAEWNLKRWMGVGDFSWIAISDAFAGVETKGENTLVLKLKRPVPAGLLELTIVRPVRFLSPKAVNAHGKQTAAIGTGPWILESTNSSGAVLVRNDAYWGEKPAFSRIELSVVPDELARANALRSGDLDIIGGDWVAPLSPRRAKSLAGEGVSVVAEAGTATLLLGFSPKSPLMQDIAVRKAIFNAIDRQAVAAILFEGYADPIADLFPANIPLSGKRHDIPKRDVAAVKTILTNAGWADSGGWSKDGQRLALEFLVSEESLPGSRRIAEMVQGQLAECGIQARVTSVDNATMHDRRPAFEYDLTFFTTYGAPYDPHGTLGNPFVSTVDSGPDGKIYITPALDALIKTATDAAGDAREPAMQAVYDWLYDNVAICPLVVQQRLWAHSARVENFNLPTTDYDLPFKGIALKA